MVPGQLITAFTDPRATKSKPPIGGKNLGSDQKAGQSCILAILRSALCHRKPSSGSSRCFLLANNQELIPAIRQLINVSKHHIQIAPERLSKSQIGCISNISASFFIF